MKTPKTPKPPKQQVWQKTNRTNLVRHVPTGALYARVRIKGKLKWQSLKTDKITVAEVRLQDVVKRERRIAENQEAVTRGNMTFNDALVIHLDLLNHNAALKPRTKEYWNERINALLKSWPELKDLDVRKISKTECLKWSAKFRKKAAPSNYNNTVGVLRQILNVAVEHGLRYENPAEQIKRTKVLQKPVELPSNSQFLAILDAITQTKVRYSTDCKDLVSFLAYGGLIRAQFVLIAQLNTVQNVRIQFLEPHRNDPKRELNMIRFDMEDCRLRLAYDSIAFLATIDANMLLTIHSAEQNYLAALSTLAARNAAFTSLHQNSPVQEFDAQTGRVKIVTDPRHVKLLKDNTDALFQTVDRAVKQLRNEIERIEAVGKKRYPDNNNFLKLGPIVAVEEEK